MSNFINDQLEEDDQRWQLPKRIILIRHGQCQANVDLTVYGKIPDHKIPLTVSGQEQSKAAGKKILEIVSEKGDGPSRAWNVYFYVSPYERTRATLKGISEAFPGSRVIGVKEESRVREQNIGNFVDFEKHKRNLETRERFGTFFYRFPEGESGADVFDRVSSFLESLWRDIDMNRFPNHHSNYDLNLVIVTHGLAMRVFLMRWFKWTVEQFGLLKIPENCEYRVMQLGYEGEYSLAIQHNEDEMKKWGLSPEMIEDQKWKAYGPQSGVIDKKIWYCDSFFDHLGKQDDGDCDDDHDYDN